MLPNLALTPHLPASASPVLELQEYPATRDMGMACEQWLLCVTPSSSCCHHRVASSGSPDRGQQWLSRLSSVLSRARDGVLGAGHPGCAARLGGTSLPAPQHDLHQGLGCAGLTLPSILRRSVSRSQRAKRTVPNTQVRLEVSLFPRTFPSAAKVALCFQHQPLCPGAV